MNRFILFVIGVICGTVVTSAVHQSHIVQTNDQWLIVPRAGVSLKDAYADVRHWTIEDWRAHPELARDLIKSGHADIMKPDLTENDSEAEPRPDRLSHRTETPRTHRTDSNGWDRETDRVEPLDAERSAVHRSARRHNDFDPESVPE
jgi:hypothetical protein